MKDFFSVNFLVALALVLSMILVGYNSFLLPDYEEPLIVYTPPSQSDAEPEAQTGMSDGKVHLNTADATELQTLPGIGPALAQRILVYRAGVGVFTNVEELLQVKGIGEVTLEEMRPYLALH